MVFIRRKNPNLELPLDSCSVDKFNLDTIEGRVGWYTVGRVVAKAIRLEKEDAAELSLVVVRAGGAGDQMALTL